MSVKRTKSSSSAVELELFRNRFAAVAEEMGAVLEHTGFSPNIHSRRDFSCALFDPNGGMVTHAAHIPVHLGSTPLSVAAAREAVDMRAGDVVILNDPFAGGTHLPDVTLVAPVVRIPGPKLLGYVANRAHHADIGGSSHGSMPLSREIFEEGLRIPPIRLVRAGELVEETVKLFLANTRVTQERLGDLHAQIASLNRGGERLCELASRFGERTIAKAMSSLQDYSTKMVRDFISRVPAGRWPAVDHLDDDGFGSGPVRIAVAIYRRGSTLHVDFSGSSAQVDGPLNANLAVTTAAVFYVIASLVGREIPANRGMMDPVRIHAPLGSIVNCEYPSSVAGGNVETSQRIVDVLLRALAPALPTKIPAASCGSMSNLALGGYDTRRKRQFSYYETIAGGAGGGPTRRGASAVQTHMTNTRNTSTEVLEAYYPLEVVRHAIRRRSGGRGAHPGGDGIDREIRVLVDSAMTLLADRRALAPYGIAGGGPALGGTDYVSNHGRSRRIPAKASMRLDAGAVVRIRTPGGGGWGRTSDSRRSKN
jgi:N-methylhydantoinase B